MSFDDNIIDENDVDAVGKIMQQRESLSLRIGFKGRLNIFL